MCHGRAHRVRPKPRKHEERGPEGGWGPEGWDIEGEDNEGGSIRDREYKNCLSILALTLQLRWAFEHGFFDASEFSTSSMSATRITFPNSSRGQCISEEYSR